MQKARIMLSSAVAKLDEKTVYNIVFQSLQAGIPPYALLEEVKSGMDRVNHMYRTGHYFLGDLIMAAEIFRNVLRSIMDFGGVDNKYSYAPIVFGTVEKDIHDIGKNIAIGVLQYGGFQTCDLGVNVTAAKFVEAIQKHDSQIVCLTGLLTCSYESMKKTVQMLDQAGLRGRTTVIIGGSVNVAVKEYTGADYWSTDCIEVVELCRSILIG